MARRRPRLITVGAVLRELGYQYRRADRGAMTWQDCAAAARVLREIRHCLEASDIERRLVALEEAAADDPSWPHPDNGAGHVAH